LRRKGDKRMSLYQQYPVDIEEGSEFAQAIKQGAAVVTIQGPNMQHGVPAGRQRLVAALAGNFYYGPFLQTMIKPVAPPFEDHTGRVPEVDQKISGKKTPAVFP